MVIPEWIGRSRAQGARQARSAKQHLQRLYETFFTGKRQFITAGVLSLAIYTSPVAAAGVQTQQASNLLCGSGFNIGQLATVAYGLLFAFFIAKSIPRFSLGIDKMGSTKSQSVIEGKEQAMGGVYSVAAALIPFLAAALFQMVGFPVVQCIMP